MPTALRKEMTDKEILEQIAKEYADPSNWQDYEKDMGGTSRMSEISAWIKRDQGHYARSGLALIKDRSIPDFTEESIAAVLNG